MRGVMRLQRLVLVGGVCVQQVWVLLMRASQERERASERETEREREKEREKERARESE